MTKEHQPLTREQAEFAADNEHLIAKYLCLRHLPVSEFYDVAVFGYLRAVRRYLTIPALQKYRFTTIAYKAMECDIGNHFRNQRTAMRAATVRSYNEDTDAAELVDQVTLALERDETSRDDCRRLHACLTPGQSKIIQLKADGYTDHETARECGIRLSELREQVKQAQDNVIRLAPDLALRAA